MFENWLDLPATGVLAVLTLLYAGTAIVIVWLAFGVPCGPAVRRFEGVVAPFFGAIAILFALMSGFLAGDIADRNRQAARAVQAETAELRNVFTLSVAAASDMRDIRAAWTDYVGAIVSGDWPAMLNGQAAASADSAYDSLLREVSDPQIASEAGAAVHAALLTATIRAGTARSERLALASDNTSVIKWTIVLILGVMTQIGVGIVHLQRPRPHIAALLVFTVAAIATIGLIALQENPFAGDVRIGPDALQALLKHAK